MIKKIYFVLIGVLFLFILLNFLNPLLLWDENVYLGNARANIKESNFTEDFRFPLLEYLISLVWLIFGESIIAAKLLMISMSLLTIYFFYRICEFYFKKNVIIYTLIFSFSPILLFWGFRAYPDIPALMFMVISFYLILKERLFWAGFMAGLSFLAKFPLALFPLSVGVFFVYKKEIKNAFRFSLGFVVPIIPWMLYNYISYGNIFWDALKQLEVIGKWTTWQPMMKQVNNALIVLNVLLIFIPFGIYNLIKKRFTKYDLVILINVLFFIIYYFFFVDLKLMRYYLAVIPFLLLLSFIGIEYIINKVDKKYLIIPVFLVFLLLAVPITIFEFELSGDCQRNSSKEEAIKFVEEHTSEEDLVISNFWPWFGYYNNVRTSSLWNQNITEFVNEKDPDFVIYSDYYGNNYDKEELSKLSLNKTINDGCGQRVLVYNPVLKNVSS